MTESALVRTRRARCAYSSIESLDATVAMDISAPAIRARLPPALPIDVLKIDAQLHSGMIGDADSIAIVRAVLSLADALGMSTTAEGGRDCRRRRRLPRWDAQR